MHSHNLNRVFSSLTLLLCWLVLSSAAPVHKFYVSICQIDHNPETEALEISMRIFTDDLEAGIESDTKVNLRLATEDEHAEADRYIQEWIQKDFKMKVNGEEQRWNYIGKEVDFDVAWIYLEIEQVTDPKTIQIQNSLLLRLYQEQVNMVHLKVAGEQKSIFLRHGEIKGVVEFP